MNVLIYDGPGVSAASLAHTIYSLKRLLSTRYAIQTISAEALALHPWAPSCALLVFPGGRDVPYVASLAGRATENIQMFVRKGGSFLGLCAGAYFASRRCEWEAGTSQEVVGDRPLGFFPGISEGCVYKGFQYGSEAGARAIAVQPLDALGETIDTLDGMYYNGGGHFIGAENMAAQGVKPLLQYINGEGDGKIAAVACKVERGIAVLSGVHVEYPLFFEPAASALNRAHPSLSPGSKQLMETARSSAMADIVRLLKLQVKSSAIKPGPTLLPLPQFFCFTEKHRVQQRFRFMERVAASTSLAISTPDVLIIRDQNDTFHILDNPDIESLVHKTRFGSTEEEFLPPTFPKTIAVLKDELPIRNDTPYFDVQGFIGEIENSSEDPESPFGLGDALLYGESVTSTQTLLDRNPALLRCLPAPLVSIASFQSAGRGRGSNVWIAPEGNLSLSILVRPPTHPSNPFPTSTLVFVQYLAGLAVTETCRSLLGSEPDTGGRVRLKWPNDIYIAPKDFVPSKKFKESHFKKVGGVLVGTNFSGGDVDVIIGIGLNVLNEQPTMSLSQLNPKAGITLEHTAAVLVKTFESMWEEFVGGRGSFEPFMELYRERWLHSDQVVTLATVSPPLKVRLVGLTPEHGLLRTMRDAVTTIPRWGEPDFIDLQPDGNSFDMMAGLIKVKM